MKTFALAVASVFALSLGLAAARPAVGGDEAPPAVRTFKFTYAVNVPKSPEGAKRVDVWVPLPLEDDLQKVVKLESSAVVKGSGKSVKAETGKDGEYGNPMLHVGLDAPADEVVVSWTATITRTEDRGQGKGPMHERFKQADKLVPIDGKAAELAKELGVDKRGDARARGKKIYDDVLTTMKYSKEGTGWGQGSFEFACTEKRGNCTDFHAKFTGIGRAAGIPVRFTMGIPMKPDAKGTAGGYHCWAHFHDGTSWIPVDISEAQKINDKDPAKAQWFFGHLDPDRIALSIGRDITLAPKQQGEPLLFFGYPYVEVDGKKIDLPKETRAFTWDVAP